MSPRSPIGEAQLDELLNTFFLQENSREADLAAARFVLGQHYNVTIDPGKERALLERLNKSGGSAGRIFLVIAVIGLLAIASFFIFHENRAESKAAGGNSGEAPSSSVSVPDSSGGPVAQTAADPGRNEPFIYSPASQKFSPWADPAYAPADALPPPAPPPAATIFSETEFAAYERLKFAVLEKILGIDEKLYTRVEEGKVKYAGRSLEVDAFVIRNYAITNREYKAFLADLVKSGRTNEYGIAAVRSEGWSDYRCHTLAEDYFSDKRYDDFPVVNISREAAQLYCSWLEKQLNDLAKAKNPKARTLKVRLPYDHEWIYAAKAGYAEIPDCAGYNTIYDPREGLVDRAFLRRIAQVKKMDKSSATPMDALFALNRYGMSEEEVLNIFEQGLRFRPADTLYPSGIASISKAAHVSEMIRDLSGKPIVMGSCWKSKEVYQQMLEGFSKRSGSPHVGFRVVITGADKGSYKNPFW